LAWPSEDSAAAAEGYPADVDILPESLRNLEYPIDWEECSITWAPRILKPFSGGGEARYKVHDAGELIAAYDGTAPTA